MPKMKIIKAYCKKTNKYYCIELHDASGKWEAINFVDLTAEQASKVNSELDTLNYCTSPNLLSCYKCGKRNIAKCACAKKTPYCTKSDYFYQCIYCNDLVIVSPSSGKKKIFVTSPKYDNIGKVLNSLSIPFQPYAGHFDCDMLFINCGTSDKVDPGKLNEFVKKGGCVYASDLTDTLMNSAFPGLYKFGGHSGKKCRIDAEVVDPELHQISGSMIKIEFDLSSWAILESSTGKTLLRAAKGNEYAGKPIMVQHKYGDGFIFYTCFHNHAQASEKEKMFLQLLLLKQLGTTESKSVEDMGTLLGVNLASMKERFSKK